VRYFPYFPASEKRITMIKKHLLTIWALFLIASLAIAQEKKPITWQDIPT